MAINDKKIIKNLSSLRDLNNQLSIDSTGTTTDFNKAIELENKKFDEITEKVLEYGSKDSIGNADIKNLANFMRTNGFGSKRMSEDDKELVRHIEQLYVNPEQLSIYSKEYHESQLRNRVYEDYDLIMKFLPITKSIIRDNVVPALLSPNDHTKNYLNITRVTPFINHEEESKWKARYKEIETKMELPIKIKELTEYTCYYGIQYVRVVPYNKLMTRMLRNLDRIRGIVGNSGISNTVLPNALISESWYDELIKDKPATNLKEFTQEMLKENFNFNYKLPSTFVAGSNKKLLESDAYNFKIPMNKDIMERIDNHIVIENESYEPVLQEFCANLIKDDFSLLNEFKIDDNDKKDLRMLLEGEFFGKYEEYNKGFFKGKDSNNIYDPYHSAEALFASQNVKETDKDFVNVEGVYYKRLCIRKTRPIKINDIVTGYWVFENLGCNNTLGMVNNNTINNNNALINPYNSLTMQDVEKYIAKNNENYADAYTMRFAELLVRKLNKKFLENNNEFVSSVYEILKYYDIHNNNIDLRIYFIPADEVVELKINNGISLLDDALFPGKLYVSLLLSNFMLKLLRGQDKRVYYIKQGIDSNVTNTMMHAIQQIKKGEMNLSDFGNMHKIFNNIGRFTDLFIPVSPNGERPFDFEIMSGQDVQIDDPFMEDLKKSTILALGTPYGITEYDERTDLATRLVSENIKFAYQIIYRQMEFSVYLSRLMTKIVQAWYPEHKDAVKVTLPAPINLKLNILSDQLNNMNSVIDMILETLISNQQDENIDVIKAKAKQELLKDFAGNLIDWERYIKILDNVKKDADNEMANARLKDDLKNQ